MAGSRERGNSDIAYAPIGTGYYRVGVRNRTALRITKESRERCTNSKEQNSDCDEAGGRDANPQSHDRQRYPHALGCDADSGGKSCCQRNCRGTLEESVSTAGRWYNSQAQLRARSTRRSLP